MGKSKILKTLAVAGACMCAPILLSGCTSGKDNNIDFRVQDGYIQVTKDGTTWENLIELEDIKGQQGIQGVDGKQIELKKTGDYIQWRYVGESSWKNLVALEDIKGNQGEDSGVETYTVELNFTTPTYWKYNSFTGFSFEDLIFDNDIWMRDSVNTFTLENGYEYIDGKVCYDVPSNEWIGKKLPDITKTEFHEYFKGWYISGTDIEINQYSFIGGDVSLEIKWDEENMRKYFVRSAGIGVDGVAFAKEDVSPLTPHRKYVIIPEYFHETMITSIGTCNYEDPSILKDVVLPRDNITSIGNKAFYNCINLDRKGYNGLYGFNNLETIGESAFEGSGLCKIWSFDNNKLKTIGANAFKDTNIYSIYITENITSISDNAFSGCDNLTSVYIDSEIIVNNLASNNACGGLLVYAEQVYINEELDVSNSSYLLENFIKQDTSDKDGYNKYIKDVK